MEMSMKKKVEAAMLDIDYLKYGLEENLLALNKVAAGGDDVEALNEIIQALENCANACTSFIYDAEKKIRRYEPLLDEMKAEMEEEEEEEFQVSA